MKVRLETSGKIVLFVVLGVVTYFGITHFRNKNVSKSVSDSTLVTKDSGKVFSVDTSKVTTIDAELDTVTYVKEAKRVKAITKRKIVAPKNLAKPAIKAEPKKKAEGRGSLEISNY